MGGRRGETGRGMADKCNCCHLIIFPSRDLDLLLEDLLRKTAELPVLTRNHSESLRSRKEMLRMDFLATSFVVLL